MIISTDVIIWALILGIIPVVIWLLFWLKEDDERPEPKRIIVLCLLLGGAAVFGSIALEKFSLEYVMYNPALMIIVWSAIEETLKYIAAIYGGLRQNWYNEPIDALIYMAAVAIGFAAVENSLYLIGPLGESGILEGLVVGKFRFIGASMLHFVSSLILGAFIAFSFYKRKIVRRMYVFFGLSTAIALHAIFNLLIIRDAFEHTAFAFILVWICIIVFIGVFERIKKLSPLSEDIV